jgi:hypothetical protein
MYFIKLRARQGHTRANIQTFGILELRRYNGYAHTNSHMSINYSSK